MDDRTRPTGADDDTGELSRQLRGRRKAKPHRRRALHVAVLVPLAIASASWAAVSLNTPIREATNSWFPDGYNVAVAPGKSSPTTEPETTTTEDDSEQTAGKQRNTTPETTEARNRVPVTTDPSPSSDDGDRSRSDDTDDPAPQQPDPEPTKRVPAPPTTKPTAPPSDDPEPQPTVTERPTSPPTNDPGPDDDGDDEEDGGIIDIDIELPLPLPLVAAPGPEASSTGTNSLVETGIPGAVPGTGKQTSIKVNVADLATWTYFIWQSLA